MSMENPKHIYSDLHKFSPMVQSKILLVSLKHATTVILYTPPFTMNQELFTASYFQVITQNTCQSSILRIKPILACYI